MEKTVKNLIDLNMSASQICDECNISHEDLFSIVTDFRTNGLYYYPIYGNNGEIFYTTKKINSDDPLRFKATNGVFTFLSFSDAHAGSMYDALPRLLQLLDYASIHDIHFIFNSGDSIDGPARNLRSMPRRISEVDKQINNFLYYYPATYDLVTVTVLGDHDFRRDANCDYTFNEYLREHRHDIKVFSSGCGSVFINDKEILLCHDASDPRIKQRITDDTILISGHSHKYKSSVYTNNGLLSLRVINPSISRLPELNGFASGFIKWNFIVENGVVTWVYTDVYGFDGNNKIMQIMEQDYSLSKNATYSRRRKGFK